MHSITFKTLIKNATNTGDRIAPSKCICGTQGLTTTGMNRGIWVLGAATVIQDDVVVLEISQIVGIASDARGIDLSKLV